MDKAELKVTSVEKIISPEGKYVAIPKIEVFFSAVITSCHDQNRGVISMEAALPSTEQVVVAVGPNAKVKVGDFVKINFRMFPVERIMPKHEIGESVPTLMVPSYKIGNDEYMYLSDQHIMWKIEK